MIIKDLWEGHPVSERQLKAVLKSPGVTDSFDDVEIEDPGNRTLTLRPISSRISENAEELVVQVCSPEHASCCMLCCLS